MLLNPKKSLKCKMVILKRFSKMAKIICRGNIFDRSVKVRHEPITREISCNLPCEQRASDGVYFRVINKYFAVSQCTHAWQLENLAKTKFVENFGRAKQILSVHCVWTLIWAALTTDLRRPWTSTFFRPASQTVGFSPRFKNSGDVTTSLWLCGLQNTDHVILFWLGWFGLQNILVC